jgi:hypothetical protein
MLSAGPDSCASGTVVVASAGDPDVAVAPAGDADFDESDVDGEGVEEDDFVEEPFDAGPFEAEAFDAEAFELEAFESLACEVDDFAAPELVVEVLAVEDFDVEAVEDFEDERVDPAVAGDFAAFFVREGAFALEVFLAVERFEAVSAVPSDAVGALVVEVEESAVADSADAALAFARAGACFAGACSAGASVAGACFAGASSAEASAAGASEGEATLRAATPPRAREERVLREAARRSRASRAMSPAMSPRAARVRSEDWPSLGSPEKNMSTGREEAPLSPGSADVRGWLRVRRGCSAGGVDPPGISAPRPRPSPRFCVMSVLTAQ